MTKIKIPWPSQKHQAHSGELKKVISQLETALEEGDTNASEILVQLEEMSDNADFLHTVSEIRKLIDAFDYETASELLENINT